MARARIAFEAEEKKEATCQLPAVSSELPAPRPTPNVEPSTPSMDSESMVHDEKAPNESDRVEFPVRWCISGSDTISGLTLFYYQFVAHGSRLDGERSRK
jgi:hypothetical protein